MPRAKLHPKYLRMVQMQCDGYTNKEIATAFGMSDMAISQILNSLPVREYIEIIKQHAIDTSLETQTRIQSAVPFITDQIIEEAINGTDPRTKLAAGKTILEIAGHTPTKKLDIRRVDTVQDKYAGKSAAQIRAEIIEELEEGTKRTLLH